MSNINELVLLTLLIINAIAFILMGIDKLKASFGWWRIPETLLFACAVSFGAVGVLLGMLIFRHKIRKPRFYLGIPLLLILNLICANYLFYN